MSEFQLQSAIWDRSDSECKSRTRLWIVPEQGIPRPVKMLWGERWILFENLNL